MTACSIEDVPSDVRRLFEHFALEIAGKGFERYSADAILHRIRWHERVERGHHGFLCNDRWTSCLSRWMLRRHPELPLGFFELRGD